MKKISQLFIMGVLMLMIGCSTTGTKVGTDTVTTIKKGETTEQEVIAMLGEPTSTTVTPDRKVLIYDYQSNNSMGRSVATSAGSIVGGMIGGSLGSLAGSLAGGSAIPNQVNRERLSIEIDPATQKVITYQHQRSDYQ